EEIVSIHVERMTTKEDIIAAAKDVHISQLTIAADIDDCMEENAVHDVEDSDIDSIIAKLEDFRTSYRMKHNELRLLAGTSYDDMFGEVFNETLQKVKNYILNLKHKRKLFRKSDALAEANEKISKRRSFDFLFKEINNTLENELQKSREDISDDEIMRRKNNFRDTCKQMDDLSNLVKEILSISIAGDPDIDEKLKKVTKRYDLIHNLKETYVRFVNQEVVSRELTKQELFKEGKLNINLPKFSGFDSKVDYYTFKSDFLKLHERTTPKRLMPDLLKKNFLDGSALSLVSSLDNIDNIWAQLKEAYGDAKLLLKNKLSQLDKISSLWKSRNPATLVSSLSKLINVMKDLMNLASEHGIEAKLYSGDGIEKIYMLLGDDKLTHWLSHISDMELNDKRLWVELTAFLVKDMKVQQQKLSIQNKCDESKQFSKYNKSERRFTEKQSSHYSGHNQDNTCHFCDGKDHVATNGPKGSKLIQYFACQKFAEMQPHERYLVLKEKGLCVQCLFPGVKQENGKHKEGWLKKLKNMCLYVTNIEIMMKTYSL
ncbi:MAG: hypothetical protein MK200_08745, partial [Nitrosopumilus sp.]|nr:hypothetical protein [Nitrosopumilus sp.]